MLKILICGSRSFEDYSYLAKTCEDIVSRLQYDLVIPTKVLEVVSGHNPSGGDKLGEQWAKKNKIKVNPFPADWDDMTPPVFPGVTSSGKPFNKLAGYNRNQKMVDYILPFEHRICIAFDQNTPGTKDTIKRCKKASIQTYQIRCEDMNNIKIKIWNQITQETLI